MRRFLRICPVLALVLFSTTAAHALDSDWSSTAWAAGSCISGRGSSVGATGSGLTQLLIGNAASANPGIGCSSGNATICFGANAIRSLTFTLNNSSGLPRIHGFGLYNISFQPVTGINSAWTGIFSCFAAGGIHRSSVRRKTAQLRDLTRPRVQQNEPSRSVIR